MTRATKIKTVTVRIEAALHDKLLRRAELEDRSISSVTRRCIHSALAVDRPDLRVRRSADAQTASGLGPGEEGGPSGATPIS